MSQAMSLHDEIKALGAPSRYIRGSDFQSVYASGWQDARRAAAELALKADEEISDLNSRIEAFKQAIDEANRRLDVLDDVRGDNRKLVIRLAELEKVLANLCSHRTRSSAEINADWDAARAALEAKK